MTYGGEDMFETDKIACHTPAKSRGGVTNIPKWKYDCVRRAILICEMACHNCKAEHGS